jgi:hypothetical protein
MESDRFEDPIHNTNCRGNRLQLLPTIVHHGEATGQLTCFVALAKRWMHACPGPPMRGKGQIDKNGGVREALRVQHRVAVRLGPPDLPAQGTDAFHNRLSNLSAID